MATWTLIVVTLGVYVGAAESVVQLDLAPNSIDDMYMGCQDKMEMKVKTQFLPDEKNQNANFSMAWTEALKYYNKKWNRIHGKVKRTLGKEQIMALYVYTLNRPKVYQDFNAEVRAGRNRYKSTFGYHALHFYLTTAIKALNSRKPAPKKCQVAFRRVDVDFSQDVLNREIRFGSFTSGAMGTYPTAGAFGDRSCFEIHTCYGADISIYSKFGEGEGEILIPPYEVFKVTRVQKRSKKAPQCTVVYKVNSTRSLSGLNCALF